MAENYFTNARDDAAETADEFIDQIVEQIADKGEASDDLHNDYPNGDSWHHETHVDKEYDLEDAAAVLKELREHKETDKGLWEGLEPEQAISAQAAYTYGAAVLSNWRDLIKKINQAYSDVQSTFDNIEEFDEDEEPTGFIEVEYNRSHTGGVFKPQGTGEFAYVPATAEDLEAAFEQQTGLPRLLIVGITSDELYDESGEQLDKEPAAIATARAEKARLNRLYEAAELDDEEEIQFHLLSAALAGKDIDDAKKEQIKKLVEKTIEQYKG